MATRRDDAVSEEAFKLERQAVVRRWLSQNIESQITTFGQGGFVVHQNDILALHFIGHERFRPIVLAVVDEIVQEYRQAGWDVSYVLNGGEGVSLTFK